MGWWVRNEQLMDPERQIGDSVSKELCVRENDGTLTQQRHFREWMSIKSTDPARQ